MGEEQAPAASEGDAGACGRAAVLASLAPVTVIVGHYGVGKTNLALNLAIDAARAGYEVVLADLDVVNPYFRSSEYRGALEAAGARLVAPVFSEAGTSLDVPSLTGGVAAAIAEAYARAGEPSARPFRLIIDVGGDDAGATALGRFSAAIAAGPHALWYVVNPYRSLTPGAAEALAVLGEVEVKARLRATALVANAHLKADTDAAVVARALPAAGEAACAAGLPLAFATAPKRLARQELDELSAQVPGAFVYPVEVVVRTPWETES
ncbi:ParA family protein [Enterorhabdus sp. P55]|uniref:nucleotide-binding protein n=1 Tax=Enterorhabdus sp. P55 TaxID=2304571 RepID=UPI00136D81AD|nr:ParA family protein [Enterorhabdus sp. P55]NBI31344.1 ParA family protein [Enterorhabdus sp. P55]